MVSFPNLGPFLGECCFEKLTFSEPEILIACSTIGGQMDNPYSSFECTYCFELFDI